MAFEAEQYRQLHALDDPSAVPLRSLPWAWPSKSTTGDLLGVNELHESRRRSLAQLARFR